MKKTIDEKQANKGNARRNTAIGFVLGALLGGLVDSFTGNYGLATVIGMIVGALLGYRSAAQFHLMEYSPGVIRSLVISGVLFFASLLAFLALYDQVGESSLGFVAALVPVLTGGLFILALGYAISTLDELQRRIQTEAISIGFGITALIVLGIGLFGLVGGPQPEWLLLAPVMVGGWLAGKLWTQWRY